MRMVRVQNIQDGMQLAQDIPAGSPGGPPMLRQGFRLTKRLAPRLLQMNVRAVWVDDAISEGIAPIDPLAQSVRETAEQASSDCLNAARSALRGNGKLDSTLLRRIEDVVAGMTAVLQGCPPAACALDDLSGADSYTHTHSVRVATIGIMLADHIMRTDGWVDWEGKTRWDRVEERLVEIGTGLLLHDIGKIAIPSEILNKPGRLTVEEFDLIKTHPSAGISLLDGVDLSPLSLAVIRDHHERWDGQGYPAGKNGADLHLFPRIAAAADTFDAVTADRPYKPATAPHIGVKVIREGAGTQFDPQVAKRFSEVVMPYPLGHTLQLPDGRDAVIADVDSQHPNWPLLRYRDESGAIVEERLRVDDGDVQMSSADSAPAPGGMVRERLAAAPVLV